MNPTEPDGERPEVEADPRFPSGPWTGYFLQKEIPPGKHWMELDLTFRDGQVHGEGRDRIGTFAIKGRYDLADGKCWWTKSYVKQHSVAYQGYNEGKGIWGTWEVQKIWKGGFYIWPVAMGDPTQSTLTESVDQATEETVPAAPAELVETVS